MRMGRRVRRPWKIVLVAVVLAGLIGWVVASRTQRMTTKTRNAPEEQQSAALPRPTAATPPTPVAPGTRVPSATELDRDEEAQRKASAVIAASRAAYLACRTYEDDGTLDTVFRGDSGHHVEKQFHTAFAGPNAVRFAYREADDEFGHGEFFQLIATDAGAYVYVPWGDAGAEQESSLGAAVASFAGISSRLSVYILPLLPSELRLRGALDLPEPRADGSEEIDGVLCDRIDAVERRADGTPKSRLRVWIARDDHLIRRMTEDEVENQDDRRRAEAEHPETLAKLEAVLAEAGVSSEEIDKLRRHDSDPLNTFDTVTYHPMCNRPIAPQALRVTDGSL
jgi:hypothetical protein